MEGGGYATTGGGRYQALWAVRQLLLLIAEEVLSVRIEPAGVEGEGVDVIVTLPDERKEYHQCKRSNRRAGKWSLAELASRGVLTSLNARLRADDRARFVLVSMDSAAELRDLAGSARDSLDPDSFYRDQVRPAQARRTTFSQFCEYLKLDRRNPGHLELARNLLGRCDVILMGDSESELRELRSHARRWVDGDPGAVVAGLESWALERLRSVITAPDVDSFLRSIGYHPRRLDRDPRILPALRRNQARFECSLAGQLIQGQLLPREEAATLLTLLLDPEGPRFIALHGPAGAGKTGVLLEATRRLSEEGLPYLPIRLDRQRPTGSLRQFGESLDLPESPALCLGAISAGGGAVLLLDQLDALRWTGADAGQTLDACRELVREAMTFPRVRVVACCRSFDLEHDPQISDWIRNDTARKLPVQRLSEETVKQVIANMGVEPAILTARQLNLLRTIQLLRTWEEAFRATSGVVDFATERELLDAFWSSRLREAERMNITPAALQAAVERIVDFMDRNCTLVAPRRLIQGLPSVEQALQSLNVITVTEGTVTFCHQSYLDHQLAHLLLGRLERDEVSVEGWLSLSHQSLSRREQLRLVLEALREEQFDLYLSAVRSLLGSSRVRFHLKQLVLEVIGRVEEPRAHEIGLVLSLLRNGEWREHVLADVLVGHPAWFSSVDDAGTVAGWLERDSDGSNEDALRLLATVVDKEGERCAKHLGPLVDRGGHWPQRIAGVLRMAPAKDSPSVFDLRIRLIEEQGVRFSYLDWKGLGGTHPSRFVRLLTALLTQLSPSQDSSSSEADHCLYGLSEVTLEDTPLDELMAAWNSLLPQSSELIGRGGDEARPRFIEDRGWTAHLRDFLRRLAVEMVQRDALVAIETVAEEHSRLGDILLLEALPQISDAETADRALKWLTAEPHRLRLRWSGTDLPWAAARPAVENLTRLCSPKACASFERFLFGRGQLLLCSGDN